MRVDYAFLSSWRTGGISIALAVGLTATACSREATPQSAPDSGASTQVTPVPSTAPPVQDVDPQSTFGGNWKTDFSKHSVPFSEIRFLGLGRVSINSDVSPIHETIQEATPRLSELEPVIVVEVNGQVRAYPQSMLIFVATEVVNDVLGGVPIAVTW